MAEAPRNVLDFLDKLKIAYKPAAVADLKSIRTFAESYGLQGELKPWDVGYYSEKLRRRNIISRRRICVPISRCTRCWTAPSRISAACSA